MSTYECTSIYDVLDALRKCPGMYLGNRGKKSFVALIAFITGLDFAELDEGEPPFWKFSRWITGRIEGMSTTLPWEWMDEKYGSEQAFEQFFNLLDEYRTCRIICVAKTTIQVHKSTFHNSEPINSEKPIEVYIAQFVPSDVYSLVEVYINKRYEYFPYHKSIHEAKEKAKSQWGVLDDEWFGT
ncbi:MAG TPA: hypothetical protein V6C63_18245 [Allocoleopsis sp.]